jgi:hypothetical protein
MAIIAYKYIPEDSHTWIRLEEGMPKVKVVTGEIIEVEESRINKMQMHLTGFRRLDEEGEAKVEGFDAVTAENAENAKSEAKKAKAKAKEAEKAVEVEAQGNEVPEIVVPTVEVEAQDDGKDAVTVKVTK